MLVRDELLERCQDSLPGYLNLKEHVANNSLYNTPPTFAIYVLDLVVRWLDGEVGGLDAMLRLNRQKAQLLYQVVDESDGFYSGHALPADRSLMNVTFRLPDEQTEKAFLSAASDASGGCAVATRLYGAVPAAVCLIVGVGSRKDQDKWLV